MKKNIQFIIISLVALFSFSILSSPVPARADVVIKGSEIQPQLPKGIQTGPLGNTSVESPKAIVAFIFQIITAVAGVIFLVMLLIGGIRYLASSGNEEGTTAAKKSIFQALIGLFIVLSAYAIGAFVINFIK